MMVRFLSEMKRVMRLFAFGFALLLPSVASAEKIPLSELSTYLTGLKSLRATFVQYNSDGSQSKGTLYLKRPGRMRFEYDAPNDVLVIAGGGQVAIFDPRSNTGPQRYPLSQTPLALILDENTDLTRSNVVSGHGEVGEMTSVVLQDPRHRDQGRVELMFFSDPTLLGRWITTDNTGDKTTVVLKSITLNTDIAESKFNIVSEMRKRGF